VEYCQVVEGVAARITRRVAEIFLDAQQLVVLGDAVGTDSEPVLICSAFMPTAMSAMVLSSVSPERCEMTAV
jgi:hypothetical protein